MERGQNRRKLDRVKFFVKRKDQAQHPPSSEMTSVQTPDITVLHHSPSNAKTGDRQRTRAKYLDATKLLRETVKAYEGQWGSFDFPELKGEPENFDDSLFREKINTVMEARQNDVNDQKAWAKCRHAVQCAFTAFSPFAKTFLTIAKEGQAVFATPCLSHQ
jgi:hypothetical protein